MGLNKIRTNLYILTKRAGFHSDTRKCDPGKREGVTQAGKGKTLLISSGKKYDFNATKTNVLRKMDLISQLLCV